MQAQRQLGIGTKESFLPHISGLLQRRCACGTHTMSGGQCAGCAKNKNSLQRKLAIGASNDPLEREADGVADQVMAAPAHSTVSGADPHIQRFTGQANGLAETAPASVDYALASAGRPLDPALQQDMGQRFDHDFSRVRVHSAMAAEQSAREVSAHAYTVEHNVVLGAGQFVPGTYVVQRSNADRFRVDQINANRRLSPIVHFSRMRVGVARTEPTSRELNSDVQGSVDDIDIAGLKRRSRQRYASLEEITEEAGSAACNPDTGEVEIQVDYKKFPICMVDCAFEHEKAHKVFMKGECSKLAAAFKAVEDATKQAKKTGSEADLKKAEDALKKAEEATNAYDKWFSDTCRENEANAYQTGINKCNTKKAQDECTELKETAKYKSIMTQWETFKNDPPNCPKVAKKKEAAKVDEGKKHESKAPKKTERTAREIRKNRGQSRIDLIHMILKR